MQEAQITKNESEQVQAAVNAAVPEGGKKVDFTYCLATRKPKQSMVNTSQGLDAVLDRQQVVVSSALFS